MSYPKSFVQFNILVAEAAYRDRFQQVLDVAAQAANPKIAIR